ncbi:ATP-binding protein [Sphaerisporangium sp. B11E5]|uniref:ATP-binding protein n=1 Tax=Sphaerisporangium sp. B11E5 TaxID=3153563 RepID=UPI00325CF503
MSPVSTPRSSLVLTGTPQAVKVARSHTADVLTRWGVQGDVVETVQLVVSELATNAVRHPQERQGQALVAAEHGSGPAFELSLELTGDTVKVSVWDQDSTPPVRKQAEVEATGGRGVLLVEALSKCWGHHPAPGRPGKVVWAEVAFSPASFGAFGEGSLMAQGEPPGLRTPGPSQEMNRHSTVGVSVQAAHPRLLLTKEIGSPLSLAASDTVLGGRQAPFDVTWPAVRGTPSE